MKLDISKMDGYEFEIFVADLLRKMGFVVEETKLSGDGGIDLIAYSRLPIFKGTYLVQCKKWEGIVGEPPLRDLYGVVLSNKANKGILVTNSFFSRQAIQFADGKNLELIDGAILEGLITRYYENDNIQGKSAEIQAVHFTNSTDFEQSKYLFFKQRMDTDKRNLEVYMDLFDFMYTYVLNCKFEIMYSGLLTELLEIVNEMIRRFGTSGKKGEHYKRIFSVYRGIFFMLLGRVSEAIELVATKENLGFDDCYGEYNFINFYYYYYPHHYQAIFGSEVQYISSIEDDELTIYKVNLISLLNSNYDEANSAYLGMKFHQFYDSNVLSFPRIIERKLQILLDKNSQLVKQDMENAIEKKNELFFLPLSYERYEDKESTPSIQYTIDKYVIIEDIKPYWSKDLDYEAQKQRISFLFSLGK